MSDQGKTATWGQRLAAGLGAWRYGTVLGVFLLVVGALAWRLVDLHVVDNEFLRKQGDVRTIRVESIDAHRGVVTDRHGESLAVSTPVQTIWANPSEIDADEPRLTNVARLLGLQEARLRERLRKYSGREFIYLRRKLQPEIARQVLAMGIPGVYSRQEYRRYYPAGEVTAHVVGFTNIDESGQEGIELAYNQWLSGESGRKRVLKDNRGRVIKDLTLIRDAKPGRNLELSIDLRLQYLAYRELKAVVGAHDARGGTLVMLDVDTGEVLAMVNQGSYNPNDRSQLSPDRLRNKAITDLFEPGSTMKPVSMAAALESGKFKASSTIDTAPGYRRFGRFTIRDHRNYGVISLTDVIAKSSNVGISKIATELGGDTIRDLYARLGLGQPTGIGFPGEAVGVLPAPPKWRPVEEATLSYGYGMSVNALQLAQAYMVLANGGIRYPLSLLKADEKPVGERVLSEDVSFQIREMLREVVENGTGKRAQPGFYSAGGKTGTVHLVGKNGYEDSQYKAIFAGMAPIDNPRIVTVVAVDAPQSGEYYGGEVAAPVFARVMGDALRLLNVKPELELGDAKAPRLASGERG
ncbi:MULTISPECIES: peptidoglycan D,D-transpeptidase FtsI family protein [Marinobacter]|uniref:Peptidoglycan D,D-transpeptidase FtsI n=1 Tax=Marinobacter salarius TaxID=1420917 RepID=A0ABY1FSN4_9GAMM|nr:MULTISPECIES: penicillin-binding protein 2 [Marinobacter]KXJ44092.1 MAG: cell division protein [Marinobacter sp. Hex_13]MBS8233123.1 penicillin-binding protein 2 [Marinobacter salarius]MDP4534465.1 penicillin-binding protein 2 [Marinobacter salarius]SFM00950.1 cell division protein FtsI (penicillin-binding protein 3) [Marinobacter salarius]VVT10398.1 transpeptidase involved in septal peptidoglycan synthesis (penicillin-binding protein 3) [Marinobacter salarius]